MKKILITGQNSFIGTYLYHYLLQTPEQYSVDKISTRGLSPTPEHFRSYDVVINVAGIAHTKETSENKKLYYEINYNLAVKIAKAAKAAGVKQYILLSSMSVYGLTTGHITKETKPNPNTAYGESKLRADNEIQELASDDFLFVCLRPPMVYGKGCKGNYQTLRKIACKFPIFPDYPNQRSMIYIGNLCRFIKTVINEQRQGLFFPQNAEYVNTSKMVRLIAEEHEKTVLSTKIFNWFLRIAPLRIIKKAFGNLTYELVDTIDTYSFVETIYYSEN